MLRSIAISAIAYVSIALLVKLVIWLYATQLFVVYWNNSPLI
jgi:hypothetical protein